MTDHFNDLIGPDSAGSEAAARAFESAETSAKALARTLSSGLGRSLRQLIYDGGRVGDVFRSLALDLSKTALTAALRPLQSELTGALTRGAAGVFSGGLFADGAAFSGGRALSAPVRRFARGGVVSGATAFPTRSGLGLMGEAGPEAILPLARGPDGRLGVESRGGTGGGAPRVSVTITTKDAESFRRSRSQVAAQLARALERSSRLR